MVNLCQVGIRVKRLWMVMGRGRGRGRGGCGARWVLWDGAGRVLDLTGVGMRGKVEIFFS